MGYGRELCCGRGLCCGFEGSSLGWGSGPKSTSLVNSPASHVSALASCFGGIVSSINIHSNTNSLLCRIETPLLSR